MNNISDIIEEYLKKILNASKLGYIEIRRSDLAEQFSCVPSQINYVISTRFTPERGYVVESKRGGGGYIRIRKIAFERKDSFAATLIHLIGDTLSQREAEGVIYRLQEESLITSREALMLVAAIQREVLSVGLPLRDTLRANLLTAMLLAIL